MLAAATTLPLMVVLLKADWTAMGFSSAEATETNALATKTIANSNIAFELLLTNGQSWKNRSNTIDLSVKTPLFL